MAKRRNVSLQPPAQLLRCVRSPKGMLIADVHDALPCRNPLYIGAYAPVIERVAHSELPSVWFAAEAGGEVTQAGNLFVAQAQRSLYRAACESLSLANKSRQCVLGLEAVINDADQGKLALVVIAADAGRSSRQCMQAVGEVPCVAFGTRELLGGLFGRHAQVFIGIRKGAIAQKLHDYLRCCTGFTQPISL